MRRQGNSVPPSCVGLCCSHSPAHWNSLPVSRPRNPTPGPPSGITSGWGPSRAMLTSPPCFFVYFPGLAPPDLFSMAAFLRLPIGGCLPKGCATHSPWYVIIPGLFFHCGAEVAPRWPCAGSRGMYHLTASPAAPTFVWPTTVRCYVAKAKAAIAPVKLLLPANPAGCPRHFDVGRLEKFQGFCLL